MVAPAVVLASVLVWVAGQSDPAPSTVDGPGAAPDRDGSDPSSELPAGPPGTDEPATVGTDRPEPGEQTRSEDPDPDPDGPSQPEDRGPRESSGSTREIEPAQAMDPPAVGFHDETRTVLLFDDGYEGALAVDLDTWQLQRVPLPGQRPGDQTVRLSRLGDRVVVGWEEIWTGIPGRPQSARQLGRATVFVPHADPQAVWLIDYAGGGVGVGSSTWTLVDAAGTELVIVPSVPAGLIPVRGVPGGLVVATPNGTLVYDLEQDRLVDTPIGSTARVAGAARDRVVWCDGDPCERLVVTDPGGRRVATIGSGEQFAPRLVWVSPDGDRFAAWARVEVGTGVDFRLRAYRTDDGERLADIQVPLGELFGDWTDDGGQFFAWIPPQAAGAPANLYRWSGGNDIERLPVADHGVRDVSSFLALSSDRFRRGGTQRWCC